jgi:bla regulator protein BlaR1
MTLDYLSPLANHLWQSTLCAAGAWLLTLTLRRNRAAVRYWIWLAASAKFLIPFSLLVSAGSQLGWRAAPAAAQPQFSSVMDEISQPFGMPLPVVRSAGQDPAAAVLPSILAGVWLCGFALEFFNWSRLWRHVRTIQRTAAPLNLNLPIRAFSTTARLEPGVFGIRGPVLLLPEGITDHLTPPQLEAVLAHELCHVRRRDNLTATIHMAVEAIFWFHPLVWWIRERLVEERERACDEEVLRATDDPQIYAEGILNVCRFYLASPLTSVSGVTGANLKLRMAAIVANRTVDGLDFGRKLLLAAASIAAIAGPIAIGILYVPASHAQSHTETAPAAFEAASVKPSRPGGARTRSIEPGRITYLDTTLGGFIQLAYGLKRYQISGPDWIMNGTSSERFDVVATAGSAVSAAVIKRMLGPLLVERFHLAFHRETRELPVYALAVAKGGSKIQAGDGGAAVMSPEVDGGFSFKNWSMSSFADWLSMLGAVGRPVIDRTGLEGAYSFHANLFNLPKGASAVDMKMAMSNYDDSDAVFAALREHLGLKLEAQKAPIEFLVIDHADKVPVEN